MSTPATGQHSNRRLLSGSIAKVQPTTAQPEIALLLSTYQKPWHLRRVLASIAQQDPLGPRMELIVTDDGSTDETAAVVEQFASTVAFPVRFVTHPHAGFQLARCRNEGVRASTAPYLLFLDGDCLLPPDHVRQHWEQRRPGEVWGGYCVRLDRETSERIDEEAVRKQSYLKWVRAKDLRKLKIRDWKARFYRLIRHSQKPKLAGGNIGLWRADYERVNGYDERFQGWGGEDDDLRRRLAATGVRIGSILRWTRTYHLWHPPVESMPGKASTGDNYQYLSRRGALTRCRRGLISRSVGSLNLRLAEHAELSTAAKGFLTEQQLKPAAPSSTAPTECELAFFPGARRFSTDCECRLLVVLEAGSAVPRKLLRQADVIVSHKPLALDPRQRQFRLDQLPELLAGLG